MPSQGISAVGRKAWIAILCVACFIVGLALVLPATLDGTTFNPYLRENGPVEVVSALGYVLCVLAIVVFGGWRLAWGKGLPFSILLLTMAARELDFHNRFWTHSVSRIDYYFDAAVPLAEKLLAPGLLAAIGVAVVHVAVRYLPRLVAGVMRLDPVSVAVALGVGSVALSKGIDGIGNRLSHVGYEMSMQTVLLFEKFEEVVELGIWMYFMIAIVAFFLQRRAEEASRAA